jgi:predicted O-methyltransferase YrrM
VIEQTMNPVLSELIRSGVAVSESGKTHKIHSQIPEEEGLFLKSLVAEFKPRVSLEVGLAYGISALFICEALCQQPEARHIVIDPHQVRPGPTHVSFEGVGLENLKRAGYESLIEFHDSPSHLALPWLVSQGLKIDFALIDGWHTFDYASTDFFYIDLLLRPGGVVAIDDTDFPSVWKLCRYIVTNRAYSVVRCLPAPKNPIRLSPRVVVQDLATRISRSVSRSMWPLVHNDKLVPYSRCIAFRKEADDTRSWDFDRNF